MKKLIIYIFTSCLVFTGIVSCDEDIEIATINDSVEANIFNELSPSSIVLTQDQSAMDFQELTWTAPDYGYQASVSYTVQLAVQGTSFTPAVTLATVNRPSLTVTNQQINNALLNLGLTPEEAGAVEFRTIANVGAGITPVSSNAVSASITPFPPASNPTLYIIGDAQGWDLARALQLEYVGAGEFEGIGEFVNNGYFRFFEYPSWDAPQMGGSDFSSLPADLVAVGDGDDNFRFEGSAGIYTIHLNTNEGTITMEAADTPELFIIGGDQGWNLANAFPLDWLGGGKYEGTTTFSENEIFRFFEAADWGAPQHNFDDFEVVDERFESDGGGDSNFRLLAPTSEYTIYVDLYNSSVTLSD